MNKRPDTNFPSIYEKDNHYDVIIGKCRVYKAGYILRKESIKEKQQPLNHSIWLTVAYTHQGVYIGGKEDAYYLCVKKGIKPTSNSLGFNEQEQKWYGWSHRAILGFGIGSEVKFSSSGYKPSNKDDFFNRLKESNKCLNSNHSCEYFVTDNGIKSKSMFMGYPDDPSQDKFIGDISENFHDYPEKWGKGEWVAKTLEDAKEMAIDFASSVS